MRTAPEYPQKLPCRAPLRQDTRKFIASFRREQSIAADGGLVALRPH